MVQTTIRSVTAGAVKLSLLMFAVVSFAPSANAQTANCEMITELPATIDRSGQWCLMESRGWNSFSQPAIEITADNVQLNLKGNRIFGSFERCAANAGYIPNNSRGRNHVGIRIGSSNKPLKNVSIANGSIERFAIGIEAYAENLSIRNIDLFKQSRRGIRAVGNGDIRNNRIRATGGIHCTGQSLGMTLVDSGDGNGFVLVKNYIANTWARFSAIGISMYGRVYAAKNFIVNTTTIGMKIRTDSGRSSLIDNRVENTSHYYNNQGRFSRRGVAGISMFIPFGSRNAARFGYRGNHVFKFDEGFQIGFHGTYLDWGGNAVH